MTPRRLATVTLVVPDYDAGIRFFCAGLGWDLLEDIDQGTKRWVVVAPEGGAHGARLLLARADGPSQTEAIGRQAGDRVAFFYETEAFEREAARLRAAGARFLEEPRDEPYGRVAQWQDPFGNLWDLLQPSDPAA
ncbi:MAG: VOC family protein [Pseudomonadota bacterium]